jgi:uncharacterized protein YyaL (SSP411 family)
MTGGRDEFRFSPRPNRAAEIAWRPWGEEAFAEARRLGRPVLLSLSAVWCHWCHVMDETSYSDPRVIEIIDRHYLPVRVDNDRNPDVNRRYNMGGWPTTAFLTGSGEVLTGATYVPPDQMVLALERVRAFFEEHRHELAALEAEPAATDGEPMQDLIASDAAGGESAFAGDPGAPGDLVDEVALAVVRAFDPLHGGIGKEPKFPQADTFGFLLAYAGLRDGGASPLLAPARLHEVLRVTLTRMAAGDVYDRVGDGFFRYATQRDWSTPHYEKMLEDNARLALLYLDAWLAARSAGEETASTGEPVGSLGDADSYRRTAEGVLDYLLDTLWQGDPPVFSGSQDADERYYRLDAEGRGALDAPFIDTTVYVDWNALAAQALLRGASVLGSPGLAERAVALLDHLWDHARRDGALVHYLTPDGGQGATGPLLTDQAAVAAALLDADWVGERLGAADGRIVDRPPQTAAGGLLAQAVPALEENALMADVLLRLESYTGDRRRRERAVSLLAAWVPAHAQFGVGAAPYAATLLRCLERPDHLVVVGAPDDDETAALHAAALAAPRPLRTVERLDPHADGEQLAARGLPADEAAAAIYVCRGASCLAPAHSPRELRERLAAAG